MIFNEALGSLGKGEIAWVSDDVYVTLHTTAPDIDADQYFSDIGDEVSASGSYVAGGVALANKSVSVDDTNNRAEFDADDVVITGFTGVFRYIVVRKYNATASLSRLICYVDLGANVTVTNSTYTITWNADGVFQLRNGA